MNLGLPQLPEWVVKIIGAFFLIGVAATLTVIIYVGFWYLVHLKFIP